MKKSTKKHSFVYLVLIMFITVTYATFNTNLFIDGQAVVRVDADVRITNIEVVESTNSAYDTYTPTFTKDSFTINTNLPKQNSTQQYRITITNNSIYDYDVADIIEQTYSNTDISYEISGLTVNSTVLSANTTSTFLLTLSNNTTITEEPDVYQNLTYDFNYTGTEEVFVAPYTGEYTLEVWGAQGGNTYGLTEENELTTFPGGYGGYATGKINLTKGQRIYINVGGQGGDSHTFNTNYNSSAQFYLTKKGGAGGYNGGGSGGNAQASWSGAGGGGGATHIATVSGLLKTLENKQNNILIVAGAGGGNSGKGGCAINRVSHGGGYQTKSISVTGGGEYSDITVTLPSATQSSGFQFGQGENGRSKLEWSYCGCNGAGGGGGGYYGGNASTTTGHVTGLSGVGGTGYIGNSNLTNKGMYCYQCEQSSDESTKTTTTNNHSETPISQYAKEGNGHARITINAKIEDGTTYDYGYVKAEKTFAAPYTGIYKLETWGAQGGSAGTINNVTYTGGYGGYSKGTISLNKNDLLYINVGGAGAVKEAKTKENYQTGGYNGGGGSSGFNSSTSTFWSCGGGGATHIAKVSGLLKNLETYKGTLINNEYYQSEQIIMVAGGGGGNGYVSGGSCVNKQDINAGGGYKGVTGTPNPNSSSINSAGGTQTTGYAFGEGMSCIGSGVCDGGGAGFYGGYKGYMAGGGGSGYIGNNQLTDKVMYCYECEESSNKNTKTKSTKSHSTLPIENVAKEGHGHSKITLVQRLSNNIELSLKINFVKKVQITYDYQYPYNYYTPNTGKETYTFTGFTPDDIENVCSSTIGRIYITDWHLGDLMHYEYDTSYVDLTPSPDVTNYTIQFQGNGNVKGWNTKIVSSRSKSYKDTGGVHVRDEKSMSAAFFENAYFNMSLRTDGYISGSFTISNVVITRISKDSSKIRVTQNLGTLPTPDFYNNEYEFVGWFDAPTGGNMISNNASIPDTNKTYYAHWNKIYDITYDLDGGSFGNNAVHPDTYTKDSSTFTISNPTREGYEFIGWNEGNLFDYETIKHNDAVSIIGNHDNYEFKRDNSYVQANIWPMYDINHIGLVDGKTYTLSFDIWSDENTTMGSSLYVNDMTMLTHNLNTVTTTKQLLYATFQFNNQSANPTGGSSVHIYPSVAINSANNIYIGNIQINEGTEVKDYTKYAIKDLSIANDSTGNRTLKAIWRPIVELKKETYIEGFDGWSINKGYIDSDGVLVLGETAESDRGSSPYYNTNKGNWWYTFEAYTNSIAPEHSETNQGGYHTGASYYDENKESMEACGYESNGFSGSLNLEEWTNGIVSRGISCSTKPDYVTIRFSSGTDYAKPIQKIRNFKLYGEKIPNDFYLINVNVSNNVNVSSMKYAQGSHNVGYMQTNGANVSNNQIRVTQNGIYTVYVKDTAGNESVQEIEITNIVNAQ